MLPVSNPTRGLAMKLPRLLAPKFRKVSAPLALVALAAPAFAQSQMPQFDPASGCGKTPLLDAESGGKVSDCLRDEQDARTRLEKRWSNFPAASRHDCVGEIERGGPPSYVELLTCFEMFDEAAKERRSLNIPSR